MDNLSYDTLKGIKTPTLQQMCVPTQLYLVRSDDSRKESTVIQLLLPAFSS